MLLPATALALVAVLFVPSNSSALNLLSVGSVWTTTSDGSKILASSGSLMTSAIARGQVIAIDPFKTAQTFAGVGASMTETSAALISALPSEARAKVMASLFGSNGLRLSLLRQPLGSSDFVTDDSFSTYEDTAGAFDLGTDRTAVLPLVREAKKYNPALTVMGTPWSAPARMKYPAKLAGGTLASDQVDAYATYLAQVASAYAAEGTPLADLTIGNEPELETTYPSMKLSVDQQAAVLRATDAKLTELGLPTKLWAYDHNWSGVAQALSVLTKVSDVPRVVGAAFHCYAGDPTTATSAIRKAGWRVRETECTGTDSVDLFGRPKSAATTFADTLGWQSRNLIMAGIRNGSESLMLWNLALNGAGGPHFGWCGTRCNGVLQIEGTTVTKNADYAVLGHVSQFVTPGAKVLQTKQSTDRVENVAFVNPNGSRVVVLANYNGSTKQVALQEGGRSLNVVLAPGSLTTVTWR